jgi:UPF0716 protein FxsA
MPLFLIFVLVPIVEIALFIQVGGWIGLWPTLGIVVATAFAGTILVRTQGVGTLRRLRANLEAGRDPMGPIAHGALILVAGVLLLTPGFFTDAVALALMVPAVRRAVIAWGASRVTVMVAGAATARRADEPGRAEAGRAGPQTVEAEYVVVEEEAPASDSDREREREARRAAGGRGSGWVRPPD